jgi:hypothetical protein
MNYTHTRNWQSRVAYSVATLLFAYPFVAMIMHVFQWETDVVVFGLLLLAANSILFGREIYDAIARRGNFVCAITDQRLRCECPDEPAEYSFDIDLAEILDVVVDGGDVTLKLQDGREYHLTSNYGNPRGYFITLMMQANPAIKLERR